MIKVVPTNGAAGLQVGWNKVVVSFTKGFGATADNISHKDLKRCASLKRGEKIDFAGVLGRVNFSKDGNLEFYFTVRGEKGWLARVKMEDFRRALFWSWWPF